ncbi:PGG domain, partial [Dillenia turbinata]
MLALMFAALKSSGAVKAPRMKAMMLDSKYFSMFVICDNIALYSSVTVVITLMWAQLGDIHIACSALKLAFPQFGMIRKILKFRTKCKSLNDPSQTNKNRPFIMQCMALLQTSCLPQRCGLVIQEKVTKTPRKKAAATGHIYDDIHRIVEECPALLIKTNSEGDTTLHIAARAGSFPEINAPIHDQSDWTSCKNMLLIENEANHMALHETLRNHHREVAEVLVQGGPERMIYNKRASKPRRAEGGVNVFEPNAGTATMLRHWHVSVFVLCDSIAMYSSVIVAITLIWAQMGDIYLAHSALKLAFPLLGLSFATMSLAFAAGAYLVVSDLHWLADLIWTPGLLFFIVLVLIFVPLWFPFSSRSGIIDAITHYPIRLMLNLINSILTRIWKVISTFQL